MSRATDIRKAYQGLGKGDFYDNMITCSGFAGKAVWGRSLSRMDASILYYF